MSTTDLADIPNSISDFLAGLQRRQWPDAADRGHQLVSVQGPQPAEDVPQDRHQDGLGRHHQGRRVRPGARAARLNRRTGAGWAGVCCAAVMIIMATVIG